MFKHKKSTAFKLTEEKFQSLNSYWISWVWKHGRSGLDMMMEGKRRPKDYKLFLFSGKLLEGEAVDWLSISCSSRRVWIQLRRMDARWFYVLMASSEMF